MFRLQNRIKSKKFSHFHHGFTIIEALLVLCCLLFLIVFITKFPRLHSNIDYPERILCGNRMKNQLLSLTIYADEHNNKLPITSDSSNLNEISKQTIKIILHDMRFDPNFDEFVYGSVSFYCPANKQQEKNKQKYWNSSEDYRTVGYFYIIDTKSGRAKIQGSGDKIWLNRIDISPYSERELITDIVISDTVNYKPPEYPLGNFTKCPNLILGKGKFESTSHIYKNKPAGGNIGFADGHVEWRPFLEMEKRYGDNPVCWW